jgi:hypothetical protein
LNSIKRLLAEGLAIEDIQRSLVRFRDEIDALERGVNQLFVGFEREIRGAQFDASRRRAASVELLDARRQAEDLLRTLGSLERAVAGASEPGPGQFRTRRPPRMTSPPSEEELV